MKLEEAIAKAKILNDSLKELADEYEGQGSFMAAGMAVYWTLSSPPSAPSVRSRWRRCFRGVLIASQILRDMCKNLGHTAS